MRDSSELKCSVSDIHEVDYLSLSKHSVQCEKFIFFFLSNNLFEGIHTGDYFYFLHSYSNKYEKDDGTIITTSNYGEEFISAMNIRNIYGVQFHPEKSHKVGMKLLSNFTSSCA